MEYNEDNTVQGTIPKHPDGDDKPPTVESTSNLPPNYSVFLNQFTKITSSEQRTEYIKEFDSDYMEYRSLFAVVDRSCKLFVYLEKKLKQEVEGSYFYEKIKEEIQTNYDICKSDKKYQESRRKFLFLHQKLLHIKKLVVEFDLRLPEPPFSSDEDEHETSNREE